MNAWKNELMRILKILAANQTDTTALVTSLILGVIVAVLIIYKITVIFKYPMNEFKRTIILVIAAAAILMAVEISLNIYLVPHLKFAAKKMIPLAGVVFVFFAVIVPVGWFLYRATYMKTLNALLLGIIGAFAAILLTKASFEAIKSGSKELKSTQEHKQSINEIVR